ncbi:hypothetical protein TDB9533_03112 [Thalassocella blandensis]|nr:hypothetical protein TDB9533_03112 [Thalassocella blandensis]
MKTLLKTLRRFPAALALLALFSGACHGAISWPQHQVLPSFPTPATTQDLFLLHGKSQRWQAESQLAHGTGREDGDGWLCQTGIDAANQYMIYGPYNQNIPAGGNTARFRIKIDNNSAANDAQVTLDVRNASNGAIVASKVINRHDFSVAGEYLTFNLPFQLARGSQSVELRVFWHGRAYIKVDWVEVAQGPATTETYLFSSLKGLINVNQPRLFSYEGDAFAEGRYTWLNSLGFGYNEVTDPWTLVSKYRSELNGIIVYDPAVPDTINLATTLAGSRRALIAAPHLISRLTAAPYNLPVVEDLRGRYSNKIQVYQSMLNDYWPNLTHRVVVGINPNVHRAAVREYAVAIEAATIWLNPAVAEESELLNQFLQRMSPGANFLGWWPSEEQGVSRASQFNIPTIASDWSTNLTFHSGLSRNINIPTKPAKPALEKKIYVAFVLSDGDNLQYVEHLMRKLWNNPDRGSVPIGWTVSPAMADVMPGALNFYYNSATPNDNLIAGPSGYGYTYPNQWPDAVARNKFVEKTQEYNRQTGLDVVTIWNTITGGINQATGNAFARFAPMTLGLTGQNTGAGLTIHNGMPAMALSCNYCTNRQAMIDHINRAANGWGGNAPRFVIIQAQPWQGVTPSTFKNVANTLNGDYRVVRPDQLFRLMREANGLEWRDPGHPKVRLENKAHSKWLQGTDIQDSSDTTAMNAQAVATTFTGNKTRWRLVPIAGDPDYFRIENVAFGNWLQCTDQADSTQGQPSAAADSDTLAVRLVDRSFQGDWTRWRRIDTGDGYFHLQNKYFGYYLQVTPLSDDDANGFDSGVQIRAVPNSKTGDWTRFKTVNAN